MGNSICPTKENNDERAFIRSLGDRYPLGDAELRKWCFCHDRILSSSSPPPMAQSLPPEPGSLSLLSVWCAIYGDHDPYSRRSQSQVNMQRNPIIDRSNAASQVSEAIAHVERNIFPAGLSSRIVQHALRLSMGPKHQNSLSKSEAIQSAKSLTSIEEISAFEESYYSIASLVRHHLSDGASPYESTSRSQNLEDFLEGISTSCGRRGSRSSLSKLFATSILSSGNTRQAGKSEAGASEVVRTAHCLSLAASYLKGIAACRRMNSWKDFVPHDDPGEMQSMVQSLLDFAAKQRQCGGGMGGNFGFDYHYAATTNNSGSTSNNSTTVSLEEFQEWAETTAPMLASALPTFLHVLFAFFSLTAPNDGREPQFPPGVSPLWIPSLTLDRARNTTHSSPTSSFFPSPSPSAFGLFALSCTSVTLASGRWHRLFSSEANGLSCNRLMHSLLGYGGPTIILIRTKDASDKGRCGSGVLGAYVFTPWTQESAVFYGNSDCFLFRLGPDPMSVYRPTGSVMGGNAYGADNASTEASETSNYMYFNPEARSKGYDGLAHGIGFGGTADLPRLFIDELLDGCRAAPEDLTYEKGPLLSGLKEFNSGASSRLDVEAMEAWGVGTTNIIEEALLARDGQRQDAEKKIRQAMKGAKGQFLEDFQAGIAGNKLFQHREQIRGRDGACELDASENEDR